MSGHTRQLLAEAPFVPPPHPDGNIRESHRFREWNYWMMSQRSALHNLVSDFRGRILAGRVRAVLRLLRRVSLAAGCFFKLAEIRSALMP